MNICKLFIVIISFYLVPNLSFPSSITERSKDEERVKRHRDRSDHRRRHSGSRDARDGKRSHDAKRGSDRDRSGGKARDSVRHDKERSDRGEVGCQMAKRAGMNSHAVDCWRNCILAFYLTI